MLILINKLPHRLLSLIGFTLLLAASFKVSAELKCELTNGALEAMPEAKVLFEYADGKNKEFAVRLANSSSARAAGFQRVCKSTIAAKPILFVFDRPVQPSFHMNNVVAGIDIAFIDGEGKLDSIHKMTPYIIGSNNKPRYQSRGLIQSALEAYPGFFGEHMIDSSVKMTWSLVDDQ